MSEFSKGTVKAEINRTTKRHRRVFRPSAQLPYIVHFKSGASQPALRVTEEGDVYFLECNLKMYSVRKTIADWVEKI